MARRRRKSLEITILIILSILARRRRKIWDFAIQKAGECSPRFEIFQSWEGDFSKRGGGIPPCLHSTAVYLCIIFAWIVVWSECLKEVILIELTITVGDEGSFSDQVVRNFLFRSPLQQRANSWQGWHFFNQMQESSAVYNRGKLQRLLASYSTCPI